MLDLAVLWFCMELLGLICLPLTMVVCHNLPDRGWAFSKTLGIVWLAFAVWLPLMCIHSLYFTCALIFIALLVLASANALYWYRCQQIRQDLLVWFRQNIWYVLSCEAVFFGLVLLLGYIRSYGPQLEGYEMFMNEGLLASIMRSPHFPPGDMWLSGYSINYYYYSLYILALFGKLLGQSPSIIANTGICAVFGLCAINVFGIACNLVSWAHHLRSQNRLVIATEHPAYTVLSLTRAIPYGYTCILMALIFGNLAATQQWWKSHDRAPVDYSVLWQTPAFVIRPRTNISEFPALAFILSCFHAHVLTLAFTVVAIALAFNLLLEPTGQGWRIFGRGWQIPLTLFSSALLLGGLFAMNGWDFPTYLGLMLICILMQQWLAHGQHISMTLLHHCLLICGCMTALAYLFFLPFYLTFVSPAQGIGWVANSVRSPLSAELLIYGLFIFVFTSFLIVCALKRPFALFFSPIDESILRSDSYNDLSEQLGIYFLEIPPSRQDHTRLETDHEQHIVATVAEEKIAIAVLTLSHSSWFRRKPALRYWCLGVTVYLLLCLVLIVIEPLNTTLVMSSSLALVGSGLLFYHMQHRVLAFSLLLGVLAFSLLAMCEVIFLKDDFASSLYARSNTIFKFYFQAWMLLSIACAVALFFIIDYLHTHDVVQPLACRWKRIGVILWCGVLGLLLLASMVYPLVAPYARYVQRDARLRSYLVRSNSLDGLDYLRGTPDYDAICWLNAHVAGDPGIVEALGDDGSTSQRISAFTGLSDIVGWLGHEHLWRVNWLNKTGHPDELVRRFNALNVIYTTTNSKQVLALMRYYHAEYLYVGDQEERSYPHSNLTRYRTFMRIVYQRQGVRIYQVP